MSIDLQMTKKQKAFIDSEADETLFGGAARRPVNHTDNFWMLCYML